MASVVKHGGRYYAQFYDKNRKPQRKQAPLGTSTKRVATRLVRELEDKFALAEYDPWFDNPSDSDKPQLVGDAAEAFLATKSHLGPSSIRMYGSLVHAFKDHLGQDFPVQSVHSDDIIEFLDSTETNDVSRKT